MLQIFLDEFRSFILTFDERQTDLYPTVFDEVHGRDEFVVSYV